MISLFQRLYKYKQSDLRHKKENFLTEILAYCLQTDDLFRINFLKLIDCNVDVSSFVCQTQLNNPHFGKPDIFIQLNNSIKIIIECKVDTIQEKSQLIRYSNLLHKNKSTLNYLIYLTKYFEEIELPSKNILFKHIRWLSIYDISQNCNNIITKELSNYLIEEKMSTKSLFKKTDQNAIRELRLIITKMNEFLARLKDILSSKSKLKFRMANHIDWGNYGVTRDFYGGKLWLGFYEYEDDKEMQVCISIDDIPHDQKKFKKLNEELINLYNWDYYDDDDETHRTYFNKRGFSSFFNNDAFDMNAALTFLEIEFDKIKKWL